MMTCALKPAAAAAAYKLLLTAKIAPGPGGVYLSRPFLSIVVITIWALLKWRHNIRPPENCEKSREIVFQNIAPASISEGKNRRVVHVTILCVCVCVCVCVYIYMRVYVCTCVCVCARVYVEMCQTTLRHLIRLQIKTV
jgi:hypothetical protein